METIIDDAGLTWMRSEDRTRLTCQDGRVIFGIPEMSTAYLLSAANMQPAPSDAERIAELEAQVLLLLSQKSNP
jgi:hypothetical protein